VRGWGNRATAVSCPQSLDLRAQVWLSVEPGGDRDTPARFAMVSKVIRSPAAFHRTLRPGSTLSQTCARRSERLRKLTAVAPVTHPRTPACL